MELRTVDPRTLKANPNNPRRTKADKFSDAQMLASVKAIGVLQPPLVREDGQDLVIEFGHRRVATSIKLGATEMQVLVKPAAEADQAEGASGLMGAITENLVRSEMGQVDRWRAMEALAAAGWNDAAIGEALGMTARNIAQARLLANICPGMLDQMALNDLPQQGELRIIAAATKEEQAQVWKANKPKRGCEANWHVIAHALSKIRLMAKDAKFGDAEAQAFGIVWEEDLFAPADEDSRSTTQVDAFLGAQMAWLEANLRKGQGIVQVDDYGRPLLPKGAQQHWGKPGKGVLTALYVEPRSGRIRDCAYTLPVKATVSGADRGGDDEPVRKPRPDLTAKGAAMVGDFRTDALHQALREQPIDDDQLIAMLVLALAGKNVTVMSGVAGRYRASGLGTIAAALTEGGAVTRDMAAIRHAAREALVEVLSCRENQSASGLGARFAGDAIGADAFLPNMATEAFLPALSRTALEQCASAGAIVPLARVKDTWAALIARVGQGTFVYPGARFALTEAELAAQRAKAASTEPDADDDSDPGEEGQADLDPMDDDVDLPDEGPSADRRGDAQEMIAA